MNSIYTIEFTNPHSPVSKFYCDYFLTEQAAVEFLKRKNYTENQSLPTVFNNKEDKRLRAYINRFNNYE